MQRWTALDGDLAGPFNEIRRMVEAGGKRLRPAFCQWGFVGAGGDPDDQRVVDAGAAFELMHAFALFHDDVMDDASSRRGESTTHAVYADTHRLAGWSGESRRFGEGAAILVGDLAFVLADELLVGASDPVWRMWNELRTELNIGQFLDIVGSVRGERRHRQRPSGSLATRAASTRSSGRCTSVPCSPPPSGPTSCFRNCRATDCRSVTPSRCATT